MQVRRTHVKFFLVGGEASREIGGARARARRHPSAVTRTPPRETHASNCYLRVRCTVPAGWSSRRRLRSLASCLLMHYLALPAVNFYRTRVWVIELSEVHVLMSMRQCCMRATKLGNARAIEQHVLPRYHVRMLECIYVLIFSTAYVRTYVRPL